MSRVLGVDYGEKRVGLAISDEGRKIASPLTVLRRDAPDEAQRFQRLVRDEEVSLIVVGLPIRTTGHEGEKARQARAYGTWLHRVTGLPVVFWDERFTTAEAEQLLLHAGLTKKQRKERLDKVAAQRLLQTYLDAGCPPEGRAEPLEDS